jgi:hypothetical protein
MRKIIKVLVLGATMVTALQAIAVRPLQAGCPPDCGSSDAPKPP